MSTPRKILVTGATGKQGGAVIDALLESPAAKSLQILAVTRDAESPSAKRLAAKSPTIKVIQGNVDDATAVFQTAGDDIDGFFLVTVPSMTNPQKEEVQGKAMVDAALAANVKHIVFSSVDRGGPKSDTNPTNVPHFLTKHHVEEHLKEKSEGTATVWTILRPTAFLDNFQPGFGSKMMATLWSQMHRQSLQFVSVHDIGVFAAMSLTHPEGFKNRAISLAGAELGFNEGNATYQRLYNNPLPTTFGLLAWLVKLLVSDVGKMFQFFDKEGYGADIEECRRIYPEMQDFEQWFIAQGQRA